MHDHYNELRLYPSASTLVDYWLKLRQPGHPCPHKRDFSPMHLGKALPDVFLTEWIDPDNILIRVAGSNTSEITRADVTGRNLLDVVPSEHRDIIFDFYNKMRTDHCAVVTTYEPPRVLTPKIAKTLHLPLFDDDGIARFTVGVTKAIAKDREQADVRAILSGSKVSVSIHNTNLNL